MNHDKGLSEIPFIRTLTLSKINTGKMIMRENKELSELVLSKFICSKTTLERTKSGRFTIVVSCKN